MMKSLPLKIAMASLLCGSAQAASNITPAGSNLGYSDASNVNTVFSSSANPAWIGANLHRENNYGVGLSAGIMLRQNYANELIDGFDEDVNPILDQMDANSASALSLAEDLKLNLNNLMRDTRDNFNLNPSVGFNLPIVIAHNSAGGFGVEVSGVGQFQSRIVTGNTPVDIDANYLQNNPDADSEDIVDNGLIIQSAFYTKVATYGEVALTYGDQVFSNKNGVLSVGGKLKYMQAKFGRTLTDLGEYLKSNDDDADQFLQDQADDLTEGENQTAFGVDLGAMWVSQHWQAGVSILNINSPSFDYNEMGEGTDAQAILASRYQTQLSLREEVVLSPQGRIELAAFTEGRGVTIAGAFDTNESYDLMNNPYQWAAVSASFATSYNDAWWYALVPDLRLGYRKNLTGYEEQYATLGLTFGPLNMDFAIDPSATSKLDNDELPDSFAMNIGLEVYF